MKITTKIDLTFFFCSSPGFFHFNHKKGAGPPLNLPMLFYMLKKNRRKIRCRNRHFNVRKKYKNKLSMI